MESYWKEVRREGGTVFEIKGLLEPAHSCLRTCNGRCLVFFGLMKSWISNVSLKGQISAIVSYSFLFRGRNGRGLG